MASTEVQVYAESAKFLEQERLSLLAQYNPNDHMVSWPAKDPMGRSTTVHYYPAAWRLYELSLRYPNANFKTEIVNMNEEKDTVIVKAYLFMGIDYATSEKKAEAFKQGRLSQLDRVETKAMARAARNLGVGTERALDMDEAEGEMIAGTTTTVTPESSANHRHVVEAGTALRALPQPQETFDTKKVLDSLYNRAMEIGIITDLVGWQALKCDVFGEMVSDEKIATKEQCEQIRVEIVKRKKVPAATSGK